MQPVNRPARHAAAVVVAALSFLTACGTSNSASPSAASASNDQLAVAPASYDLAVGPPSRFIVGLLTTDKTNIGYGTIRLRFTYLGTDGKQQSSGPETDAGFLQIPGSATRPPPAGPAKLTFQDGRGVYAATVGFDKPGYWQVDVDTGIKGVGRRSASGNFEVLAKHGVPAPGDPAIASDNPTLDTPGIAGSPLSASTIRTPVRAPVPLKPISPKRATRTTCI